MRNLYCPLWCKTVTNAGPKQAFISLDLHFNHPITKYVILNTKYTITNATYVEMHHIDFDFLCFYYICYWLPICLPKIGVESTL